MKKRALLIGINDYFVLNALSCARQDAEAFAQTLRTHCGFGPNELTLMTCRSEGATRATSRFIEQALADLTEARDLDLLIFGFWGHGFAPQPGRRYLCGIDTVENDLERTAVPLDLAKAKLAQVGSLDTVLVLDCCQNKPGGRGASAVLEEGAELQLASMARDIQAAHMGDSIERIPTVAVMNACREGQRAHEWESRGHGVFTAHLLDGLHGGKTSLAQLATWVCDQTPLTVRKLHRERQVPWFTIEGRGDIVLPTTAPRPVPPAPPPPPRRPQAAVHWWVVVDGRQQGPLQPSAVAELIRQGRVTRDSECWRDGMDRWQPIGQTSEWAVALPAPPQAPPRREPAIVLPDFLEPVPDADYPSLRGLAAGSREARDHQHQWVEKGYPLELRMVKTGMLFRLVPPGQFLMGSEDDPEAYDQEKPRHEVTIRHPFYMGKFPVTQANWQAVMGSNPSVFKKSGGDAPVETVSWDDCQEFLRRLDDKIGSSEELVRLPSEAQWEYACRAGTALSRYGSLDAVAWFDGNSGAKTRQVGQKQANAWGVYDMLGNVWEWCVDNWHANYRNAPMDCSPWEGNDAARVLRGGSWNYDPRDCRAALRTGIAPDSRHINLGFRVVVPLVSGVD